MTQSLSHKLQGFFEFTSNQNMNFMNRPLKQLPL